MGAIFGTMGGMNALGFVRCTNLRILSLSMKRKRCGSRALRVQRQEIGSWLKELQLWHVSCISPVTIHLAMLVNKVYDSCGFQGIIARRGPQNGGLPEFVRRNKAQCYVARLDPTHITLAHLRHRSQHSLGPARQFTLRRVAVERLVTPRFEQVSARLPPFPRQ